MQTFFSFHGRIGRFTWWLALMITLSILGLLTAAHAAAQTQPSLSLPVFIITIPLIAVYLWISWATMVCRLHDMGFSGFFCLLAFVPLANFVLLILCGFKAGTPGMNQYGPPARLGGLGHLDEAMAAFDEPDFGERRAARPSRRAAAATMVASPTLKAPHRPTTASLARQTPGGATGRPSFGRRSFSAA
ncbi:DUF805 domain-containing protein [Jiella pelagia]|uniref:DUF805 domain-containing protein n=1 Tax=Jiella pelagia TaxID=2986949 RepID=A0ABY7C3C3_9HYPH|nr:DUF805 domain-containing protein [Jiella pelagia]WAP70302.1 DUF805 domain-containing protein [Jiella pelagia]